MISLGLSSGFRAASQKDYLPLSRRFLAASMADFSGFILCCSPVVRGAFLVACSLRAVKKTLFFVPVLFRFCSCFVRRQVGDLRRSRHLDFFRFLSGFCREIVVKLWWLCSPLDGGSRLFLNCSGWRIPCASPEIQRCVFLCSSFVCC